MSKYILEIKNRLFLLAITWLSTMVMSYFYKEILLFSLTQFFVSNLSSYSRAFYFIFTDVTEIFSVYLQLIAFLSVQTTFFYFLYHLFVFLSPAFFKHEYYYISMLLKTIVIVWFFSAIVSNSFLINLTWNFFLSFQELSNVKSVNLHFEAKLNEYLTFYIALYYFFVFYCQVFTAIFFFLSYINASIYYIKKFRKLYYYIFVLFSTILSPPEILSQILISSSLIFLYEFFLFVFMLRITVNILIR